MKTILIVILGLALLVSAAVGYFVPQIKYYENIDSERVEVSKEQYNKMFNKDYRFNEDRNINYPLMLVSFIAMMGLGLTLSVVVPIIKHKRRSSLTPQKVKMKQIRKNISVGGWLLLLCIILTIGTPLRAIYGITVSNDLMLKYYYQFPHLLSIHYISTAITVGIVLLSVFVGIQLWDIKKNAVKRTKIFLLIYFGAMVILSVLPFKIGFPPETNQTLILSSSKSLIQALLFSGVWYWYLSVSKRVKATFAIYSIDYNSSPEKSDQDDRGGETI